MTAAEQLRELAREQYAAGSDNNIEIDETLPDPPAQFSIADGGAWVAAWVWVCSDDIDAAGIDRSNLIPQPTKERQL